jgi:cytochrome o ubiquinol oxidase subunit 3
MSQPGLQAKHEKAEIGFWLYLMTDLILFSCLFATYMILRGNTAGGPGAGDLFEPRYALIETLLLLTSSFTCGVAALAFRFKKPAAGLWLLAATIVLGASFVTLELIEFTSLVQAGHSWRQSAFLSSFFTLVGTHGLHITIGLIWAIALGAYIKTYGLSAHAVRKFTLFSLFWHFLDLVWIFIFTIVYLMGGLGA